jgi:hypothetical protein
VRIALLGPLEVGEAGRPIRLREGGSTMTATRPAARAQAKSTTSTSLNRSPSIWSP